MSLFAFGEGAVHRDLVICLCFSLKLKRSCRTALVQHPDASQHLSSVLKSSHLNMFQTVLVLCNQSMSSRELSSPLNLEEDQEEEANASLFSHLQKSD